MSLQACHRHAHQTLACFDGGATVPNTRSVPRTFTNIKNIFPCQYSPSSESSRFSFWMLDISETHKHHELAENPSCFWVASFDPQALTHPPCCNKLQRALVTTRLTFQIERSFFNVAYKYIDIVILVPTVLMFEKLSYFFLLTWTFVH